jgi:hypothetical protein
MRITINKELKIKFHEKISTSKCLATSGSKIENKPFIGFASLDISDGISLSSKELKWHSHLQQIDHATPLYPQKLALT